MNPFLEHAERIVLLSHPFDPADPLPPAIPPGRIEPFMTLDRDGARTYRLSLVNHSGTHADAPAHVIAAGLRIADLAPTDCIFHRPVLIDLVGHLWWLWPLSQEKPMAVFAANDPLDCHGPRTTTVDENR